MRRHSPWRSLQHRVEGWLLRALLEDLRRGTVQDALERAVTWSKRARPLLRREQRWAERNLALVFGPDLADADRTALASLAVEQHVLSHAEGVRAAEVRVTSEGIEHLEAAAAAGRGAVIAAVHLGSWEAVAHWLGARRGLPIACVHRPVDSPQSEREFAAARVGYGIEWIRKDNPVAMRRALRSGKLLIVMSDVNTTRDGVTAAFLGLPAQCPSGPARLALSAGCPVCPVFAIRESLGEARVVALEPLLPVAGVPRRETPSEVLRLVCGINAAFEPWILEYAEQYNWLHPRWRHRANGEVWTTRMPIGRQWAERVEPFAVLPQRVRARLRSYRVGSTAGAVRP